MGYKLICKITSTIYSLSRSLYRFNLMTSGNYPDVMIDLEEKILKKRLAEIDPKEMLSILNNWQEILEYHELDFKTDFKD